MKDFRQISSEKLLADIKALVSEERRVMTEILWHLREVERRRLFAEIGYPSLFEYAVKELGYSESAAYRRISAMRALKELPELEQAISNGRLSVSTVAQVQSFFRAEKTQSQKSYTLEEKKALFENLKGKSARDVQKTLVELSPQAALPQERVRPVAKQRSEIRIVVDDDTLMTP
jgi:hypothetical protein